MSLDTAYRAWRSVPRWPADLALDLLLGMPPAPPREVVVDRDIPVSMPDGVRLLGNLYRPRTAGPFPVVLIRSPYGRRAPYATLFARPLARRGVPVLLQSMRGTFGSGGRFHPFRDERSDGVATVAWLRAQPWCDGRVATGGVSYLGYAEWALAPHVDPPLSAMALGMSPSKFHLGHLTGGAFPLHTALSWSALLARQEHTPLVGLLPNPRRDRRERRAMHTVPLRHADTVAVGHDIGAWFDLINHSDPADPYWEETDHSASVPTVGTPVSMVTGWYDPFLPQQLADFAALRRAGTPARITVGPWGHDDAAAVPALVCDQVGWLAGHLRQPAAPGGSRGVGAGVYLQRAGRWLRFAEWPPPGAAARPLHLLDGGLLGDRTATRPGTDTFTYRPDDPTPAVGGPLISGRNKQRDNRPLERRDDTLVYTGPRLDADLDVVGEVRAVLHVRTSRPHVDLFVRLCDVDRLGVSRNVCDGIRRLRPDDPPPGADGLRTVSVDLWPTAYRFRRGHRLRVTVCGGAFPRFARNHGTGDPVADAVSATPCTVDLYHDEDHPSRLDLPRLTG